jgi:hypothetical protein
MAGGRIRIGHIDPGQYSLNAEVGAFNMTGQVAGLTYTPVGGGGGLSASGVSTASGIEDGAVMTISALGAENFGTGPTQILYATGGGGANRAAVNTSDPEFGDFASDDGCIYSTNFARSGGSSFYVFEGGTTTVARIIRTSFSSQTTIRVRYWLYAPTGTALPACSINGHSASQSSFKMAWLARTFGPDTTDICLPTAHGGSNLSLGGNSLAAAGAAEAGMAWEKYHNNTGNYGNFHHYGEWWMVRQRLLTSGIVTRRGAFAVTVKSAMEQIRPSGATRLQASCFVTSQDG